MAARSSLTQVDSWLGHGRARGSVAARAAAGPTVARAAIRIPERLSERLAVVFPSASPRLFVHEGARQSLERKLSAAAPGGRPVVLSITDNRHSIVSHAVRSGVLHARIHHMFLDAPPRVVDALVRYVTRGDRHASRVVGHYIDENASRLARRRARAIPLDARGDHHDLLAIFRELNDRYFDGACTALISWGRRGVRPAHLRHVPRKSIRLGSYASLERLIRIHPSLDRAWVPKYFVAYVVYHEMLHHMIPAARGSSRRATPNLTSAHGHSARRVLHPPELLERERAFRDYERAIAWERRSIGRLLRAR